jgi:hypothetical protein
VGDWGAISVTRDGGATWEDRSLGVINVNTEETAGGRTTQTITDDIIFYDVDFPDREHGYIAGEFGTVLATRDGGITWETRDVGTEKTLFGIGFETPDRGWVVGIDGLIIRTTDGGKTWQVQHGRSSTEDIEDLGFLATLENPSLYDVQVVGRQGVVIGDTGKILTSTDGGETWQSHAVAEKERLVWMRALSLAPGTGGFIVGANGFSAQLSGEELVIPRAGRTTEP